MTTTYHANHDGSMHELNEIAEMLGDSYVIGGRLYNWSLNRFWDWKFGGNAVRFKDDPGFFRNNLHIWRSNGRPIGFVISERGADVSLQVHPDHREMESEMLDWVEREWVGDQRVLETAIWEIDHWSQRLLTERGWIRGESAGFLRMYDMKLRTPEVNLPDGFRLMTLAEYGLDEGYVEAVKGAFGHATLGMEWYRSRRMAPGFSDDWNIVVVASNGRCASFCDVRVDQGRSYAEIDPIGTHPDFERRGLARACIVECFKRLADSGIRRAFIGSAEEPFPSNRLYDSLWPIEKYEGRIWRKHR